MSTVKHPLIAITVFLWIGFVCAISFMEAWLKFQAPGITIPLGLGIGRLVFNALNKVEWVFALTVAISLPMAGELRLTRPNWLYLAAFGILVLQSLWLLPALDLRAEAHISNQPAAASNLHFYYVGGEVVKVLCLLSFGVLQFKASGRQIPQQVQERQISRQARDDMQKNK